MLHDFCCAGLRQVGWTGNIPGVHSSCLPDHARIKGNGYFSSVISSRRVNPDQYMSSRRNVENAKNLLYDSDQYMSNDLSHFRHFFDYPDCRHWRQGRTSPSLRRNPGLLHRGGGYQQYGTRPRKHCHCWRRPVDLDYPSVYV